MDLDRADRRLLFEKDRDCRQSVRVIAKKFGMKRDTAAYRLARLERENIIKGYHALIDYSRLGYVLVRVYLKLQNASLKEEQEIASWFVNEKKVFTLYETDGDWDFAPGFLVKRLDDFKSAYDEFLSKFKRFIAKDNVSVFLRYVHHNRNYLVEEKERRYETKNTGGNTQVNIDKLDEGILKLIAENATSSLLDIAKTLKTSSMTVQYRLKKLERAGVLLGYRALLNIEKLWLKYYKLDINLEDVSRKKKMIAWARRHPNVVYEDETIGGSDIELDMEFESDDEFRMFVDSIKKTFPGAIRTINHFKARKILKYRYYPE